MSNNHRAGKLPRREREREREGERIEMKKAPLLRRVALKMEDDLKRNFKKGRRPPHKKLEDDLKKNIKK